MLARGVGSALVALVLLVGYAAPSSATQFRRGTSVTIGRDEVIDDDLMIAARNIVVEGTVRGDLLAAGNTVLIPGRIDGNVMALAQNVQVPGTVRGSLRTAAQSVTLSGPIGRNATVAAQNVLFDRGARVTRDADVAAQTVNLDGSVAGKANLAANVARVAGTTGQQLRFNGQTLQLGPTARVGGGLVVRSPQKAQIAAGAVVSGGVRQLPPTARQRRAEGQRAGAGWGFFGNLLFAFALFLVGAVGLALAPRYLRTAADEIQERPGPSILWGILLLIVVPIAALLVSFTVIGIPLSLLAWAIWGFAVLFSAIPVAIWVGRQVTAWIRHGAPLSPMANLAIGLFLLAIAWTIPIVSLLVRLAVVFFGLGMFALAARDLAQRPASERPAAAA